ncbi:MAG: ABC transporter permease [Gemella sp.]|nr:ABC transporter permease [Gemella sp.]
MKEIFISRIKKENSKRATYNKYIYNSHLVMFLIIVAGAVLFNYSNWLKTATTFQMQAVLIIVLALMSYLLTVIKIKTFIKRADSVFILPLENRYKEVLKLLQFSPIMVKGLITVFFAVAVYPLTQKLGISLQNTLGFAFSIAFINVVWVLFKQSKIIYSKLTSQDNIIIFSVYLLASLWFVFLDFFNLAFIVAMVIYVVSQKSIGNNINWQEAAEYDEVRNEKYLKFVNMFTDVPLDIVKVARRKYFDVLLPAVSEKNFKQNNAYSYYYIRAFLRQENTVFLLVRLFLLAVLFIYGLTNIYATIFIILSFNYLTLIQMLPLYKKLNESIWFYILPVAEDIKIKSFRKMLNTVLLVATLILVLISTIILGFTAETIMYLGLAIVGSVFLNYTLLKKVK